jgi:predicted dehydrogenase
MSSLRAVILGAGGTVAQSHIKAINATGGEVAAVQDVVPERAEQVAEQVGSRAVVDLDEALRVPADMVAVTAPHPVHAPLVIAALEAGRHVLVEKPIADGVEQADEMLDAARRTGRLLGVALQHRTRREVQAALSFVRSSGLGQLQRVDLIGNWPRRRSYFTVAPWRGTWRGEGGGVLINQGQHDLDLLTFLAGPPSRVVGWTRTRIHSIETEDTAVAMLEWSSGAVGSLHLSTCEVDESQRLEMTGTAGRLRLLHSGLDTVRNEMDFRVFIDTPGSPFGGPAALPAEHTEGGPLDHTLIYRNFAEAIAGREPLIAPAEDGVATLELANAVVYSSAIGEPVTLPLDRGAYSDFLREKRNSAQ